MTTQRGLEPHEYTPYAAYSDGPCRHCERGRYASIHEQPSTDDDECAFVHNLAGNFRCGGLRKDHSRRYPGHEFVEPQQPAPAAQATGEWYDHDDPRHIYHTVFNPSGCDKFYCLKRFDAPYQSLSTEQERLRQINKQLLEALSNAVRCAGHVHTTDCPMHNYKTPCKCWVAPARTAIDATLNEQGKESG